MANKLNTFLVAAVLTCATALPALPVRSADTLKAGFSTERLARVDALLDSYVNDGRVGGIVALVLRDGKPVYERAVGWADKEAGRKMTMDTEFRIASQSKALTRAENGSWTTVAAKRPITIRDLLTHTAGINYGQGADFGPYYMPKGLGEAAGFGWYFADKDEPICTTMERLGTLPFQSQPGEA